MAVRSWRGRTGSTGSRRLLPVDKVRTEGDLPEVDDTAVWNRMVENQEKTRGNLMKMRGPERIIYVSVGGTNPTLYNVTMRIISAIVKIIKRKK